ncbi:MAG: polysaccharide deacetylase family protein [Christensenellales bacterium]|jgi:polysaccharide deacetylase family sporulation protein PdaB
MKIMVISKKTLIWAATVLLVIVAAIAFAVFSGRDSGAEPDRPTGGKPQSSLNLPGSAAGSGVEQYELEVLAGLMKELPVYSVSRSDKRIALTIDAAWEDDKTDFILDTLKEYDIKATFFLCGFWVNDYPDKVKAISDAGHEIGNHSLTHPHMSKLSPEQMKSELSQFDNLLEPIIGRRTKLFRAPYGEYDDRVIKTVREAGYEVIQWNIDTVDWKPERSAQTILDTVLPKLSNGSIILCHNNGYKIEQYLPTLIESALAQGYSFVTVSDLLLDGETLIDVNGVQKPAQ